MKSSLPSILGMTLVATLAAGSALAQDAAAPPAGAPARRSLIATRCKDEVPKFCADVPPGGGRLAVCLRKHDAELSEPCKAALAAAGPAAKTAMAQPATAPAPGAPAAATPPAPGMGMGPHHGGGPRMMEWGPMHGMHKACGTEADKFCKEVPPGHGRVAVCLNEHTADLSPGCKAVVGKVMEHMNEPMQAHADCAADVQKFCADVPAGFGRTGFCLGEHSAELSPACKKHVDEMKAHWAKRSSKAAATKGPAPSPASPAAPAMADPSHPLPAPAPGPGK